MGFKGDQYLWKDRKRFLGMPLSFTRYAISEDRLFLSSGFLNIKDEEILLYRIRDLSVTRSLGQRLCGVGSIAVTSSDKSQPTLLIKNVKNPVAVKELIHQQVEEMKIRRKVRIGEFSNIMTDFDDDDNDDFDNDDPTE
jgi:uncharacterized membrane protein YdbT with pleckstrin-like domain